MGSQQQGHAPTEHFSGVQSLLEYHTQPMCHIMMNYPERRDLQEMAEVKGWFQSGHGNLSACLEEFTLCKDGSYHRLDHLGHIFDITVVPYQVHHANNAALIHIMLTCLHEPFTGGTSISLRYCKGEFPSLLFSAKIWAKGKKIICW